MTNMTPVKMQNELSVAVAKVMAEVKRLAKDDRNAHGGYNYVSVDDVKDMIRPLMAKNGLELVVTETDWGLEQLTSKDGKISINARFVFSIFLRHSSGECDAAERTTVMLPFTGAQTTGAAKSYAIKEWIKGRFLVSTGEKDADADSMPPNEYSHRESTKPVMPSVNGTPGASKAGSRGDYDKMVTAIRGAPTIKALEDWHKANVTAIDKLPADWIDDLRLEYVDRQSELKKALAA